MWYGWRTGAGEDEADRRSCRDPVWHLHGGGRDDHMQKNKDEERESMINDNTYAAYEKQIDLL